MARIWPLTGRSEEIRFIKQSLRRTRGTRGIVLAGPAGVGKTRLAREAVAAVPTGSTVVRWAAATESARAIPLGAFTGLLGPLSGHPHEVLHRAVDSLLDGAERSNALIVIDDAHLLDDTSALLVSQLVLQQKAAVVLTVRTGEQAPDAITAVWKDQHLDRLEIQPLPQSESGALLRAVLGGDVDSATANRLWELTRGNALFLRQLVEHTTLVGGFQRDAGVWRLASAPVMPPELSTAIEARIDTEPQLVREVVDLLAVCEPLDVALLGELAGPGAAEAAEDAGLVTIDHLGGGLHGRLAHPLYGEVRRATIGLLRARRLRGRIATALADDTSPEVDLRRAVLMLESDLDPDVSLLVTAAGRAASLVDFRLAQRLGRAAVAAGGGFRAQSVVAYAAFLAGHPDEAEKELAALSPLATTDAEIVRASMVRATNLALLAKRPTEALAVLDAAAAVSEPESQLPLVALRALLDSYLARPEAAAVASRVLTDPSASHESVLLASCALAARFASTGRADDLGPVVARGLAVAFDAAEFANFRLTLISIHVMGHMWAGHPHAAATLARECRESVKGFLLTEHIGSCLVGCAELAAGHLSEACRWLRDANAGLGSFPGAGGWRYGTLVSLTEALALSGDQAAAQRAAAELRAHRHPTMVHWRPLETLAHAWVAAAEGSISAATTLAHQAADLARESQQHAHTVIALHTAARFGDSTVADELAQLAEHVNGPRAQAAAQHAKALAADDPDGLEAASEHFESIGDLIAAADAAAHAADAHSRRAHKGSANAMSARAQRLADQCDGAHTPALALAAAPLPLSAREREIVTLVARGLSNQEIADRLVLSKRTVEGHLYRAGGKLGVIDRQDFAGILGLNL